MGNPRAFRTFTLAAQYVGDKYLRREEARRVRLEVQEGDAVTLRSKTNGIETWHRVQSVSVIESIGTWTLLVGGLRVPYRSSEYEFVRVETEPRSALCTTPPPAPARPRAPPPPGTRADLNSRSRH